MKIKRSASVLLTLVVGISWTVPGCGSGGGDTVQVSQEVQKKTEDMLGSMHDKMKELHKGDGKAAKKGR